MKKHKFSKSSIEGKVTPADALWLLKNDRWVQEMLFQCVKRLCFVSGRWQDEVQEGDVVVLKDEWNTSELKKGRGRRLCAKTLKVLNVNRSTPKKPLYCGSGVMITVSTNSGKKIALDSGWFEGMVRR